MPCLLSPCRHNACGYQANNLLGIVMGVTLAGAALGSCLGYGLSKFIALPPLRFGLTQADKANSTIKKKRMSRPLLRFCLVQENKADTTTKKKEKNNAPPPLDSCLVQANKADTKIKKKKAVRFDLECNETKIVERWIHHKLDQHFKRTKLGRHDWLADDRADEDEDGTITMNRFCVRVWMEWRRVRKIKTKKVQYPPCYKKFPTKRGLRVRYTRLLQHHLLHCLEFYRHCRPLFFLS